MLLHYLGKLEIQIFCRYSADMEENANKLHFKCTYFNSSAAFVNNQHGIQRRGQDIDKKFAFEGVHSKEVD